MDIIMDDMKECRVVMHKLSNDAVEKGWWSGLNRLLRPSGVGKIKSDATAASGSSLHPKVVAVNIKLEPLNEEDDISVKDEPIDIDENQQPPPSSSCVPCKEEAQVEARDAHQCASQDAAAMPKEQDSSGEPPGPGCGGQLAPPSPSATDASGSSLRPKVIAVNIKLEPLYEDDDISVKDEPIDIDENQQTPPSSSCVPCKEEAQVEARDAHRRSSQDAAAVPEEQAGSGEPPSPGCGDQLAPPPPSATEASGSSLSPKVVAVKIKLDPIYKEEDISAKDEPIDIDENQQTPPSSSCVPCKEEAQVEA
ncbi:serine/threonine-protein kinase WNK2 [Hyalella azteca]|uniref:Serine/threonine-protein kinase WNK2 n=1 Tax=Hyalella azteca TaxID=294128 RepID=A0A979FVX6_HYAAZ|nr:serine/threonine-protein kinase WNK2 [Hyalella azteca]